MESDPKLKPKLRLELDQVKPPNRKKGLWQKIKEFVSNGLERRVSGEWRRKDWGDW